MQTWKYLRELTEDYRQKHVLGFFIAVLATFCTVAASYTIRILIDDVFIGGNQKLLWPIQLIFVGLVFLQCLFTLGKQAIFLNVSKQVLMKLQKTLFAKVLRTRFEKVQGGRVGQIMSVLTNDIDGIAYILEDSYPSLFSSIVSIIITLAFMFYLHVGLTLLTMLVIPLQILVFITVQKKFGKYSSDFVDSRKNLSSKLNEFLLGNDTIRSLQVEDKCLESMDGQLNRMHRRKYNMGLMQTLMSLSSWVLILVPFQAIMYGVAGTWYFASGVPTLGLMLAFANYGNSMVGPIMTLINFSKDLIYADACIKNIEEILNEDEETNINDGAEVKKSEEYSIFIDKANLGYDDKIVSSLSKVEIKPSSINLLYGRSGCGKSTLLKSLMKLNDYEGEIYINDQDLKQVSTSSLRQHMTYVNQDPFFFSGSLRENFTLFDSDISDDRIIEILKKVHLNDFAENLNMQVQAGGVNFSGGEKMRLAIARALLRNTPVLILDEPTAALDEENTISALEIINSIKDGRTIIMSSHDPYCRKYSDNAIDLERYIV